MKCYVEFPRNVIKEQIYASLPPLHPDRWKAGAMAEASAGILKDLLFGS